MIEKIRPDRVVKAVEMIDLDQLKQSGIRALIIDIDNTLTPHHKDVIIDSKLEWLKDATTRGFLVYLLSNNHANRIKSISSSYDLSGYGFAFKPFSIYYKKILKDSGCLPHQVCCIGDQLLTDILGAKLHGMASIYVEPISPRDIIFSRFSRWLEKRLMIKKGN
ncbi:MAG: YqeG family HAD IIIA-type phosphatase [Erysipelotrichaceae bacterium]|nr:YqeG family HAD IIIA-type phosphatase [Erysipelotrichaceae bacterium]